jgi:hypothetical protein
MKNNFDIEVSSISTQGRKPRVAFFALRELHVPVLVPVWKALQKNTDIEAGFLAPPFQEGGHLPQEGLRPETLQQLQGLGIPFWGGRTARIQVL